jgi:hypothetical protein
MDAILWAIGIVVVGVIIFFIWFIIEEYGEEIGTTISFIGLTALGIWLTSIGGFIGGIGILILLFCFGCLIWGIKEVLGRIKKHSDKTE